jgi:hypothetical protein
MRKIILALAVVLAGCVSATPPTTTLAPTTTEYVWTPSTEELGYLNNLNNVRWLGQVYTFLDSWTDEEKVSEALAICWNLFPNGWTGTKFLSYYAEQGWSDNDFGAYMVLTELAVKHICPEYTQQWGLGFQN